VLEHLGTIDRETFAELVGRLGDQLLQQRLALGQRQFSKVLAVEIDDVETTIAILFDFPLSSFCSTKKSSCRPQPAPRLRRR
jgi:hypothetical protein